MFLSMAPVLAFGEDGGDPAPPAKIATEAVWTYNADGTYQDLDNPSAPSYYYAKKIIELINALVEHINNNEIAYEFLKQCLDLINNNADHKLIELIFRIKFLYLIGLAPNFNSCVNCGSKEELAYFSLFDGGMKCNNCKNIMDYHLTKEELDLFRILYLVKLDKLIENIDQIKYNYDDLNKVLNMFYSHFLGFESNVEKIYKKINN